MCKYCKEQKSRKSNNSKGFKLKVDSGFLVIQDKKSVCCPSFEINYCPFCGRWLNNYVEKSGRNQGRGGLDGYIFKGRQI